MRSFFRQYFLVAMLLVALRPAASAARADAARAEDEKPAAPNPALIAADQLYRSAKFSEAETAYRALLQASPTLLPAHVGLVRSLLRQQKVEDAQNTVTASITALGALPSLLSAKGDVQFRLSQISDAEASYNDAKELDRKDLGAHLGLMRVYRAESLYRKSYDELRRAHDIAPDDLEVQKLWLFTLPVRERITALAAYLAAPHPDGDEQTRVLAETLAYLKETADTSVHSCRLVSKVEQTETRLNVLRDALSTRSGVGLTVSLNDQNLNFQLDTGASGILVSRKIAEKAKLTRLAGAHYSGLGDKGSQSGYTAVAGTVKIGSLEFQDCVISVAEKLPDGTQDGLIGADVFEHFLVDIDLPGTRLVLSPLPKRPEDAPVPATLHGTGGENSEQLANSEQTPSPDPTQTANSPTGQPRLPQGRYADRYTDRYIAPEMAKWTQAYRFGHDLLIPTNVNDAPPGLFILDTGAFDNIVSVRAGREVTKVKSRLGSSVRGISGSVKKVYSAKVTLGFSHLQQSNVDTVAVDLSNISNETGTEISGLLGFAMLQMLDIKLDYRDGLVNLNFDPKRVQDLLKK